MGQIQDEDKFFKKKIEATVLQIAKKPLLNEKCTVSIAARFLGNKWTILVLVALFEKKKRYGDLQKQIPSISPKMLVQTLKQLETIGLVVREVFPEVPPRVEYELSDFGRSLSPMISVLCDWSVKHKGKLQKINEALP